MCVVVRKFHINLFLDSCMLGFFNEPHIKLYSYQNVTLTDDSLRQ